VTEIEAALAYVFDCPSMPHAIDVFEAARAALRCVPRPAVGAQVRPGDSDGSQVGAPG
jgi:hypothetical protein